MYIFKIHFCSFSFYLYKIKVKGLNLMVQWLRLYAPRAGAWVRSLVRENRSHMLQLKSLHCQMNKNRLIH